MKRSEAQKAVDDAFAETIAAEYRNILMIGLAADRPNKKDVDEKFRRSVAINIEAHAVASSAIADNADLEG